MEFPEEFDWYGDKRNREHLSKKLSAAQKLHYKKRSVAQRIPGFRIGRTKGFRARNILELLICRFLGAKLKNYKGNEPPAKLEYSYGIFNKNEIVLLSESIIKKSTPASAEFQHFKDLKTYNEFCIANNICSRKIQAVGVTSTECEGWGGYAIYSNSCEHYTCFGKIFTDSGLFEGVDVSGYALLLALLQIKAENNLILRHDIYSDASKKTLDSVRSRYARWSRADCPVAWKEANLDKCRARSLCTIISGLVWDLRFRGVHVVIHAAQEPSARAQALAQTALYSGSSEGAVPILMHSKKEAS